MGRVPPTRYWTVTLHGPDGSLVANAALRYGFTSGELVRRADGVVTSLDDEAAELAGDLTMGSCDDDAHVSTVASR